MQGRRLGKYQESPQFLRSNQWIKTGYRLGHSFEELLWSLFALHNETINVWTHLVGALAALPLIVATNFPKSQKCRWEQWWQLDQSLATWPVTLFIISAVVCLLCSTIYHLLHPHSFNAYQLSLSLDYAGIGILMMGSPLSTFYYTFYCSPQIAASYIFLITVFGMLCFFACFVKFLHQQKYIVQKTIIYCLPGIICAIAIIHILFNEFYFQHFGDSYRFMPSLPYYSAALFSYSVGAIVYATRFPQKFQEGKFDIFGHSHQIWHCCVVIGVFCTYFGSVENMHSRSNSTCPI